MEAENVVTAAISGALAALAVQKFGPAKDKEASDSSSPGPSVPGEKGKDGVDGKDGRDGVDGLDGKDGKDGKDGLNGTDGVNGIDGKDGVDGKDGADGKDGQDFKYDLSQVTPEDGDVVYYEVAPGFAVALYRVA